jgi:hypothetical protein
MSRRLRSHRHLQTVEKDKDIDETKLILNMKAKAKPDDPFTLPTSISELKTKTQEIVVALEKIHVSFFLDFFVPLRSTILLRKRRWPHKSPPLPPKAKANRSPK